MLRGKYYVYIERFEEVIEKVGDIVGSKSALALCIISIEYLFYVAFEDLISYGLITLIHFKLYIIFLHNSQKLLPVVWTKL